MAKRELIERERLINELTESSKHHAQTSREESLLYRDRQIVREQPTIAEQDIVKPILDKIRAEIYNAIEFERKWLCDAGHTSKDIDIALNAIKSKVKDVLEKGAESEG